MKSIILLTLIYLISSVTTTCDSGSVLNYINVCVKPTYIEGCFQYASQTKCHQCVYNYVLSADMKCQYTSQVQKPCCKTHNIATGQCQQCEAGLFLENGKCINKPLVGCLSQNNQGKCTNCAKKYYLQSGQCREGVLNCASYVTFQGTIICDQCDPGNSLINNACMPNTILGCKEQVDGLCKDCYDPFLQKNNHCEVPNCQSHNQFGCVTCECGFYLAADRKCNQISTGCIRYTRGICTDCMQHFQLKGGVCDVEGCMKMDGIRCVQCADGYQSTELGCKLKNCLISKEGYCQVCDQGYHYKEGSCLQSPKVITIIV